jgi:hypothetical protein
MVMKQSGIGQSDELIVAVDAQRTRNVGKLEGALSQAEAGETDYLTVVSGGRRPADRLNRRSPQGFVPLGSSCLSSFPVVD